MARCVAVAVVATYAFVRRASGMAKRSAMDVRSAVNLMMTM